MIKKLKVGHVHRYHLVPRPAGDDALVFVVAQGYSKPCLWACAYLIIPDVPEPLSLHFRFDQQRLDQYMKQHLHVRLDWLDADYMLQLALHRASAHLCGSHDASTAECRQLTDQDLLNRRLEGRFPQLERLLAICGEHYLLQQQLMNIQAFPELLVSDMSQIPSRP